MQRSLINIGVCAVCLLCGCANPKVINDTNLLLQSTAVRPGIDNTLGSYGKGRESRLILVTMVNDTHTRLLAGMANGETLDQEQMLPAAFKLFLQRLRDRYGIERVADWPLSSLGIRCLVFDMGVVSNKQSIVAALEQEPDVESVQLVQLFNSAGEAGVSRVTGVNVPVTNGVNSSIPYDDPFLPLQHGFHELSAGISHQWATGAGVTVAVIDSGIDADHLELSGSVGRQMNYVDAKFEDLQADGHGTAVAGIISAAANNGAGMVGIAPDATIQAHKACWSTENSSSAICNTYTLAKALNVAINNKVDIINLSLAGPRDRLLERLIEEAIANNIIVVGAQDPVNDQYFPAALNGVIAASLTGDNSSKSVGVPGNKVISTAPRNQYDFFTGSSFSTAHLSGLVALLRELDGKITPAQILEVIDQSVAVESGEVNVCLAVAHLAGVDKSQCQTVPSIKVNS